MQGDSPLCRPGSDAARAAGAALTLGADGSDAVSAAGQRLRYFGDYELLEEIARGGMGVVWKANQLSLNRRVAVKMILAGVLASPAEVQRFRLEAEAAANLEHPNIVPIYEVSSHDGQHYFSMKLVEGGSLAQWIADWSPLTLPSPPGAGGEGHKVTLAPYGGEGRVRGPMANCQKDCARLMAQIARAIHHAHQRGVLHRDLKPSNILLEFPPSNPPENGKSAICNLQSAIPYVSDFGLAKRVAADGSPTLSGAIVGTPNYMSPEQAQGQRGISTAADVYGLGAILYEILTGRPPFAGATPLETLQQLVDREPQPPRALNPLLDRDLETVCLKCLQKQPAKRYESALALAEDLERWLNGEPIRARPVRPWEHVHKWVRRRPAAAALVAVSLVATASLLALGVLYNARLQEALTQTEAARSEASGKRDEAEENLYMAQMRLVSRASQDGNGALVHDLLEQLQPRQAEDRDRRGWEWHYFKRLHSPEAHVHRLAPEPAGEDAGELQFTTELTADRRRLVVLSRNAADEYRGRLWDLETGQIADVKMPPGTIFGPVLSSDATRVASFSDLRGTPDPLKLGASTTGFLGLAGGLGPWQVLASALALQSESGEDSTGTLQVRDFSTGRPVLTVKGMRPVGLVSSVAFSRDSRRLATAEETADGKGTGIIRIWDLSRGRELCSIPNGPPWYSSPTFSPDGTRLVAVSSNSPLSPQPLTGKVWDLTTGKELRSFPIRDYVLAEFSPDGTRLIVHGYSLGSRDRIVRLIDLKSGRDVLALPEGRWVFSFSSKGNLFAYVDEAGVVNLWDAATEGVVRRFQAQQHDVAGVVFSPDDTLLATGATDGTIKIWDVKTGLVQSTFRKEPGDFELFDFSADGTRLLTTARDGTVHEWSCAAPRILWTKFEAYSQFFLSADGSRAAIVGIDNVLRVVDTETLATVLACNVGNSVPALDAYGRRVVVPFHPNPERFPQPGAAAKGQATALSISESGKQVLYQGEAEISPFRFHEVSRDGRYFVAMRYRDVPKVTKAFDVVRWDLVGNKPPDVLKNAGFEWFAAAGKTLPHLPLALSPDGARLATVLDGKRDGAEPSEATQIILWEMATGRELGRLPVAVSSTVSLSPNFDYLVEGTAGGGIILWDVRTGGRLWSCADRVKYVPSGSLRNEINVKFSDDGKRVAVSDVNKELVNVYEIETGFAHALRGYDVAFHPDGARAATAGRNGMLHVWDLRRDQELCGIKISPVEVQKMAFSRDGARLVLLATDARPVPNGSVAILSLDARPLTPELLAEQKAQDLVRALFARPLLREEVTAALQGNAVIPQDVRRRALSLAQAYPMDAYALSQASWEIVRVPGTDPGRTRQALRWAAEASRLQADDHGVLSTLGAAQCRLGQYAAAVETIRRGQHNWVGSAPWWASQWDEAFLAMAYHQLGRSKDAREALGKARKALDEYKAQNLYVEQLMTWVGEAEAALAEKPGQSKR
jgi:WD40 repeat protein/serine/threonine protein kinase